VRRLVLAFAILTASPLRADECAKHTPQDLEREQAAVTQALEAGDAAGFWKRLQASYRAWRACDDGEVADTYDQGVVDGLTRYWPQLGVLEKRTRADGGFRAFVLRHLVGDALTRPVADELLGRARTRCPSDAAASCRAIAAAIEEALKPK
jgi:hypothetical protein